MPYLTSSTRQQTRVGQNSGTVRVEWTFGNLMPDVIQIGKPVIGNNASELYAEVPINKGAKTPTFHEFDVVAPQLSLQLVVAPRTLQNGTYTEWMADDSGKMQKWYTFQHPLPPLTVAASPGGGAAPAKPSAPVITTVTIDEGVLSVHWISEKVDHFNVTLVPSIVPFQGQVELAGSDRSAVQTHVIGNRWYRFSIQGCDEFTIGKDKCSEWAVKDIWVSPEKGFQPWRRWFMIRPETTLFTKMDNVVPKHLPQLKSDLESAVLKPIESGIAGEMLQGQIHHLKKEIDPAILKAATTGEGLQVQVHQHEGEFDLALSKSVTSVTAVSRLQDHLDIFKVGSDGAVWSSWWYDDAQSWRPWFPIHPQTKFAQKSPITAVSRHSDHLDLFITGHDGAIWSSWWHDDAQSWRPWFQIHPETVFRQDRPVAAVARIPEHIDLFRVGFDGAVWSSWWHDDGQSWRPWFQIHPETVFPKEARVTALARRADHLDLFVVGHDGAVWSSWWHDDAQSWRPWFQIHPETVFRHDQEIVPVSREPEHLDLFTIGHDGAVWSSWWHNDGQGWRPWFQIHPETRFAPTARITAVSRESDRLDLFVTGLDGAVWSSWWHDDGQSWRPWFPIHSETVFDQNHPVAAVARQSEHLDLFKVGFNGAVWSAWWAPL